MVLSSPMTVSAASSALSTDSAYIRTIEWDMLDKSKFFPLSMLSSFSVRCLLYPLTLVRTRLQVQYRNDMYSGTADAFVKIVRNEGARGLYR
jgi:solute carrier family 25 protein 44